MDTFFTTFVENWATFYSFIWSHWLHAIHSIVCQLPKRPILMTIWTCLFLEKNENWRLKSRDVSVCSLELNSFLNEFNLLSKWNWKIPEHKFCNKSSENFWYNKIIEKVGCRHSSVDSSVPSILPPWVRVPSTPSMLLWIVSCGKYQNKQKEAAIGPFKK